MVNPKVVMHVRASIWVHLTLGGQVDLAGRVQRTWSEGGCVLRAAQVKTSDPDGAAEMF